MHRACIEQRNSLSSDWMESVHENLISSLSQGTKSDVGLDFDWTIPTHLYILI